MKTIFSLVLFMLGANAASAAPLKLTCENGLNAEVSTVIAMPIRGLIDSQTGFTVLLKKIGGQSDVNLSNVASGGFCKLTSKNRIQIICQNGYSANLRVIQTVPLEDLPQLNVFAAQFEDGSIRDMSKVIPQGVGCVIGGQ